MRTEVRFRSKTGLDLDVPPSAWHQLPNMCRLAQIGARCSFEADCKRIELDGYIFFSPLEAKVEGIFLREIFREDVYRMKGRSLAGKVFGRHRRLLRRQLDSDGEDGCDRVCV
jgi:hypothetical protein